MIKVIADSSSNIQTLEGICFESVPLKINTQDKEYIDDSTLDLEGMLAELKTYRGKSGTSCPNFQNWTDAFGEAEEIFVLTITGELSGSYSAAVHAAREYEQEHPGRRVCVVDSRSAGPEIRLLAERIRDLAAEGADFQTICRRIRDYQSRTRLLFCLQSLHNLAQNGRCSHAVAKVAGVLGIRVIGEAKDGQLHPLHKARGEKKALDTIFSEMVKKGFADGCRVRIAHCLNAQGAQGLKDLILSRFPKSHITVEATLGLCSYYAEPGGLMVGYECG